MELAELVAKYQNAAWLILFVWLLYDTRKASAERETKLMEHNKSLLGGFQMLKDEIGKMFTGIDHRLGTVEDKVDRIDEKVNS
jgi:hypothetical protein